MKTNMPATFSAKLITDYQSLKLYDDKGEKLKNLKGVKWHSGGGFADDYFPHAGTDQDTVKITGAGKNKIKATYTRKDGKTKEETFNVTPDSRLPGYWYREVLAKPTSSREAVKNPQVQAGTVHGTALEFFA